MHAGETKVEETGSKTSLEIVGVIQVGGSEGPSQGIPVKEKKESSNA